MAQHDYVIDNQTAPNFRADLNNALAAIVSTNSGSSAPSTTYANMLWYDTTANILKMRNEADDTWISVGYLDQSANAFRILDDTQVVNTSGVQTGLLGDQATATWEGGVGTVESLVSPAKVRAVVPAALNASGSAPIYACRAWVNFDGTTTPPTIRASGNVASVSRTATGQFRVTFTTSLPDANYSTQVNANRPGFALASVAGEDSTGTKSAALVDIVTAQDAGGRINPDSVSVAIFR
jgi:hypothetical protein